MKFAFRADASFSMGSGHVARCLTLAETLQEAGHEVLFVSREFAGHMNARLREAGVAARGLPCPDAAEVVEGGIYARMLGVSGEVDATQTLAALAGYQADWLIADHYGIDAGWQRRVRGSVGKLMVIDDLANRAHDCDILLDQNLFKAGEARYRGLVPDHCQLLIGPEYALINKEYARRRSQPLRERTTLSRILLYFGGGDSCAALLKAMGVLAEPEFAEIKVDIVAHPLMTGFADVQAAAQSRPRTCLHPPLPHLADLAAAADLAIGGGGASTWERMCLGLPSIVVVMADNQRLLAAELAERGLTTDLGDLHALKADALRDAIRRMQRPGALAEMSARLLSMCDGNGAPRTAGRLTQSTSK